jgi:peptide/nickel transport system permease protein
MTPGPTDVRRGGAFPWPAAISGVVLAAILLAVVWPELLTTADPAATARHDVLLPPGIHHWFGTDQLGRDVYSRTVVATRTSLGIGIGATAIGFVVGSIVGLASTARFLGAVLMRVTDVLLAFPGLLLAFVVLSVLGPGAAKSALAIGLAGVPHYARLVRAQALVVRRSGFVEAARTLGQGPARVTWRHVLPNSLSPLLVLATLGVGTAIVAGAGLSFLGLGAVPPSPEWGSMLAEGRNVVGRAWWIAVCPGLCVTASVVSITVLGRFWQHRLEGRRPR